MRAAACAAIAALVLGATVSSAGALSKNFTSPGLPLPSASLSLHSESSPYSSSSSSSPSPLPLGRHRRRRRHETPVDGSPPLYHYGNASTTTSSNTTTTTSSAEDYPNRRRRLASPSSPVPLSPLSVDAGTHYAHIYVGTPPQRQSVIIDTGSHFTAFPCVGCSSCGRHMDLPFDYHSSSTARAVRCGSCEHRNRAVCDDDKCVFEQSYAEGSSWEAVQFEDVLWVGGGTAAESTPLQRRSAVDFVFGCQRRESGLFKMQRADGIMGLAMHESGLMRHLVSANVASAKMFSLCFTPLGGTLALGGVDARLHEGEMQFAELSSPSGWYAVPLAQVYLDDVLVSDDREAFQSGKGTIVDSGTTDTYLPFVVARYFRNVWKDIVGDEYSNSARACGPDDLAKLPTLWFVFDGGERWGVEPREYMEPSEEQRAGSGKKECVPRVYLDEDKGAVIGANAMLYKDVLFDEENMRVGWAKSPCVASA